MNYRITRNNNGSIHLCFTNKPTPRQMEIVRTYHLWGTKRGYFGYISDIQEIEQMLLSEQKGGT